MSIDMERLLVVLHAAVDRAEAECPDALRRGEESFAAGMRAYIDVILPYVPEADRQPLIEAMAGMINSIRRSPS